MTVRLPGESEPDAASTVDLRDPLAALPLFMERFTRMRLRALARVEGK